MFELLICPILAQKLLQRRFVLLALIFDLLAHIFSQYILECLPSRGHPPLGCLLGLYFLKTFEIELFLYLFSLRGNDLGLDDLLEPINLVEDGAPHGPEGCLPVLLAVKIVLGVSERLLNIPLHQSPLGGGLYKGIAFFIFYNKLVFAWRI